MMTTLRLVIICGLCLLRLPAPVFAQPMSLAQADELFFPLIFKAYVKFKKPTIYERLRTKEPTIKTYIDPLIRDSSVFILLSHKREELIQKNKLPKQSLDTCQQCLTISNYISFLANIPKNLETINFYNTHCKPLMSYEVITIDELKYNVEDQSWEATIYVPFSMGANWYKARLKKTWWGKWRAKIKWDSSIQM